MTRLFLSLVKLEAGDHRSSGAAEFQGIYSLGGDDPSGLRRLVTTGILTYEEWVQAGRPTLLKIDLDPEDQR